jgi:nicotinamide riboside transporter PnuC
VINSSQNFLPLFDTINTVTCINIYYAIILLHVSALRPSSFTFSISAVVSYIGQCFYLGKCFEFFCVNIMYDVVSIKIYMSY